MPLAFAVQMVKNLPAMRETQVQTLDGEDPLEKGMATHCSIPAWRILWTEEPGGLTDHGVAKSWTRLSDLTLSMLLTKREEIETPLSSSAIVRNCCCCC